MAVPHRQTLLEILSAFIMKSDRRPRMQFIITVLAVTALLGVVAMIYNSSENFRQSALAASTGSFDIPSGANIRDIFVKENNAYLVTANNTGGTPPYPELFILDVSNPINVTLKGSLDLGAASEAIVVQGNYAYIAMRGAARKLAIVDISDPVSPREVGSFNASDNGLSIFTDGTRAYLGGEQYLYVLDITNPSTATILGKYLIGHDVNGIVAKDNSTVYLATGHISKELLILNVSNPSQIAEIGSLDTPAGVDAEGIALSGTRAYVVTANNSTNPDFYIVDVSRHQAPTILGSLNLDRNQTDIKVFRDRAYITASQAQNGFTIVDISDTSQPRVILTEQTMDPARTLDINPPYVYVGSDYNRQELQIYDIEDQLRPNIVFIYVDDQVPRQANFMPKLQALIENKGMTFTNSFVPTPLCCPSRASILRGEYAHNTGMLNNATQPSVFLGKDSSTIATWLHDAGYKTGLYGKYLNVYADQCPPKASQCYTPPGWDEWHAFYTQKYYNYKLFENGVTTEYGTSTADYSTDVLTNKALSFIRSSESRPFFLFLSYHAPHSEGYGFPIPAARHDGTFSGVTKYTPPNYDEEDVSDKPAYMRTYPRADDVAVAPLTYGGIAYSGYREGLEALLAVDEGIESIVNTLSSLNLLQDTVLVFSSDNGNAFGEHRYFYKKGCPHEECIRVPLFIVYPRLVTPQTVNDEIVMNIDLAPTFADLAGIGYPSFVDGASLVPLLKGGSPSWRTEMLIEYWNSFDSQSTVTKPFYRGVRTKNMKYIEYPGTGEEELYSLDSDPFEMSSIHDNPAFQSTKDALKALTQSLFGS